jgi:hypothetical protein
VRRREAVVDRDDDGRDGVGQPAKHRIVHVEIAEHEHAAMQEDDDRKLRSVGTVDPNRDLPVGSRDGAVLDVRDRFRLALEHVAGAGCSQPCEERCLPLLIVDAGCRRHEAAELFEEGSGVGVEGHRTALTAG